MCRVIRGIATFIAVIFVSASCEAQVQEKQENCRIEWLKSHWQDSTDYITLQQAVADEVLQIKALQVAEPGAYEDCLYSLTLFLEIEFVAETIFNELCDSIASRYSLEQELAEYRQIASEYVSEKSEARALEAEMKALQVETEVLQEKTRLLQAIYTFLETKVFVMGIDKACQDLVIDLLGVVDELTVEQFDDIKLQFDDCQNE